MSSAAGSQSYMAIVKQNPLTPRTIPSTPVLQKVNFSKDDLGANITTKISDHIRDDRMTTDITTTGIAISGGYEFEFQYENSLLDGLLAAFLWADGWSVGGDLDEIVKNGSFYQPFYIERGHVDVDEYFKFIGMAPNTLSLSFADQSDVTGSYSFIGLDSKVEATKETGATYTSVATTPIFSTVTNIPEIKIDDVVQTTCSVKEMDLEINNNVTPKTGLGVFGACETKAHRLSITGKITMYFEDHTMYDRLLNGTAFSVSWTLLDADGNSYKFTLPKVKLDSDKINVEGVDEDIMDDASYVALADDASGCMIQIERTT